MKPIKFLLAISLMLFFISCGKQYTPEQAGYVLRIEKIRNDKNSEMKNDPGSPFNRDTTIKFEPLKYYDVNLNFLFKSKLTEYPSKDTVITRGTKGEERKVVRFGYLNFTFEGKPYKVNVYRGTSRSGEIYHSIWFTDKTTGEETYGVGRYIDFELIKDPNFEYTLDFNLAYNPYCSYSSIYSCAIPTKEDYLDFAIKAGEKKFHH